jgi:23S rRNA (cytosine1962-C5)-methyltransferase
MSKGQLYMSDTIALKEIITWPLNEKDTVARVLHGRGKRFVGLEHVNIDYFAGSVVIYLYQPFELIDELIRQVNTIMSPENIIVQHRYARPLLIEAVMGECKTLEVQEQGLTYNIDTQKQNAGLFLDMYFVRQWLLENSKDKRVLNLFSFSCALSVAALAGGASQLINVDMSKSILKQGQLNHRLNDLRSAKFWSHDIFASFGKIKKNGPFDTIIIDPPAFQRGSINLRKDYSKMLRRVDQWLTPEGQLILTVNDPNLSTQWFEGEVAEYLPEFSLTQQFKLPAVFDDVDCEKSLRVYLYDRK